MQIVFLSYEDVLIIHRHEITNRGGDGGLRDQGLLRSAVAQPQAPFSGDWLHEFPNGMAAAYLFHIAANHPFVDGNKRAAFASSLAFLDVNGFDLMVDETSAEQLVLGVARGELPKSHVVSFFAEHVRRKSS